MIKLQKNRITQWIECEKLEINSELKYVMYSDYLNEIWKLQEITGDLPEEFEGLQ